MMLPGSVVFTAVKAAGNACISTCSVEFKHEPVSLTETLYWKTGADPPMKAAAVTLENSCTETLVLPSFSNVNPLVTSLKSLHPYLVPTVLKVQLLNPPEVLTEPVPKSIDPAVKVNEATEFTVKIIEAFGLTAAPVMAVGIEYSLVKLRKVPPTETTMAIARMMSKVLSEISFILSPCQLGATTVNVTAPLDDDSNIPVFSL